MSKDLKQTITRWWEALKAYHGVSDQQLAELIEASAWRAGAVAVQAVDRKNVAAWRSRGQFPPTDEALQAAVLQLMEEMERRVGPPQRVTPWADAGSLFRAWLNSRAELEERPPQRTVEANARKEERLSDVLIGDAERTVREAASPEGLRAGFWQGSWATEGATPPYVPRSADRLLNDRLQTLAAAGEGGVVVVVGPPKAGKTRALLEALCRTMPSRRLWQLNAVDGALDAVAAAVAADGGRQGPYAPEDVVVLIDDLQRHNFHTAAGMNDRTLKRAIGSGLVVVATLHDDVLMQMQSYAMDHTRPGDGSPLSIGATPGLLHMLDVARVDLLPRFTAEELAGMPEELVARDTLRGVEPDRLARLPELFAAVDALHQRARSGTGDREHPEYSAIILAGLDAHHLYPAGASLSDLERLCGWAFTYLHPTRHWDPYLFLRAFDWATAPLGGQGASHAIFQPSPPGGQLFGVLDPLIPRLTVGAWDSKRLKPHMDQLSPEACYQAAWHERDEAEAKPWAAHAARSGLPQARELMVTLCSLEEEWAEAVFWGLQVTEAGEASHAVLTGLGEAYFQLGNRNQAERWLLLAAERFTGNLTLLASLYGKAGDVEGRLRWLRRAAHAGQLDARLQLGQLLLERGEREEGQRWLESLAADGCGVMYRRWQLESEAGGGWWEKRQAPEYLHDAAALGNPEAMEDLAARLEADGDEDAAEAFRARVTDPVDGIDLIGRASMYVARGDEEEARVWFTRAAVAGRPEAMVQLALLLPEPEAEAWWRRAADLGHPTAMCIVGLLHSGRGEKAVAERWFRPAAEEYHLQAIRILAESAETPEVAEHWWRRGADCFDPEMMVGLAHHYWTNGQPDQAEHWFRSASFQKPSALLQVALCLFARGERDDAQRWLEKAVLHGDPLALAIRGVREWDAGDREGAEATWAQLVERESGDRLPGALEVVGQFLQDFEPDRAEMWLLAARRAAEAADANEDPGDHGHE